MKTLEKDPNYELWRSLNHTRALIYRVRREELNQRRISMSTAAMLRSISFLKQDAIQARIAEHRFLKPHSVSEKLSEMEEKGLVKRVRDRENKTRVHVEMTKKGHALYRKCNLPGAVDDVMSSLTQKERVALSSILSKLQKKLIEKVGDNKVKFVPPEECF